MKAPIVNRGILFSALVSDLWEEDFGPAPDYGLRLTPDEAAACPSDPISIRRYAVRRQLEAVDKKERDKRVPISESLINSALLTRIQNEQDMANWKLPEDPDVLEIFREARDWCHSILPPLAGEWDSIFLDCGFGPGAVFHSKGVKLRSLLEKIAGGVQSYTPMLQALVFPVLDEFYPSWGSEMLRLKERGEIKFHVERGNRLAFVHKDKSKCRTIAIEPSLNVFVQKGIGSYLMKALKRKAGIDLWDQSKNRELAKWGSIERDCATIDLSNASDRIPTKLVEYLLPADWFCLLDAARSRESRLPNGMWVRNECFSSQGNGFTFPLETLVFFSLIKFACRRGSSSYINCYGDDIIVPSCDYDTAVKVLSAAGAIVNLDKSFNEGNFRESCGGDFLYGEQVRPVYYKENAYSFSQVAGLHNLLIERWGEEKLARTLAYLRSLIPEGKALFGPRRFYGCQADVHWLNTVSTPYTSYLWCRDWVEKVPVFYDKDLQTYVYEITEWGYRTVPLPEEVMESISDNGKLLAFLYAGEDYSSSPTSVPCTRKRKLTVREDS